SLPPVLSPLHHRDLPPAVPPAQRRSPSWNHRPFRPAPSPRSDKYLPLRCENGTAHVLHQPLPSDSPTVRGKQSHAHSRSAGCCQRLDRFEASASNRRTAMPGSTINRPFFSSSFSLLCLFEIFFCQRQGSRYRLPAHC